MDKPITSSKEKTLLNIIPDKTFSSQFASKSPLPKVRYIAKKIYIGPPIPTLRPNLSANIHEDAHILYRSLWGSGQVPDILECPREDDKNTLRNILCRRKYSQKEEIKVKYCKYYSENLISCIKDKLKNSFQFIITCLLYYSSELDAYLINQDNNIDTEILIEIICTRSKSQIVLLKASYFIMFNKNLITEVTRKHSDSFGRLLKELLDEDRDCNEDVDIDKARKDAKELLSKRMLNIMISDSLIPILSQRSYPQLLQTFKEFERNNGYSFYHYIKKYSKSNYNECLKTIYCFCKNPIRYFSKKLRQGIKNKSINTIIRIVSTRCEKDLWSIIQDYRFVYHTNLYLDLLKTFPCNKYNDTIETINLLIADVNIDELIPDNDDQLVLQRG